MLIYVPLRQYTYPLCAQDAAKVHFDIDTAPIFNIIFGQHSRYPAINSLQKNGSESDSQELYFPSRTFSFQNWLLAEPCLSCFDIL